tara:strand:- start:1643 stop:1765 length:123 start_codon:yes stop_codon:yes gene_type:complete
MSKLTTRQKKIAKAAYPYDIINAADFPALRAKAKASKKKK